MTDLIGMRPPRIVAWLLIATCAAGGTDGAWAAPGAPTAPAESSGTYTVTPNGCNDYFPSQYCVGQWLEERVEPSGTFATTSGSYTNKPAGVYSYRTGDVYCDLYYSSCLSRYSSTVSVTVGEAPRRDPLDVQQSYRFEARIGNLVGDSGTDILIERVAGGEIGNGVIDAVILQQGAQQSFSPLVPTSAQRGSAVWAPSQLRVEARDINADGYVDVVVHDVGAQIAGGLDQVVFSSGTALERAPSGVRALDAGIARFAGNALDYMLDNNYFADNAPLVSTLVLVWYWYCEDPVDLDGGYGVVCYPIFYYDYVVVPDYSAFDTGAIDIWAAEWALSMGSVSRAQAVTAITDTVTDKLGVTIGGWDLGEILGTGGPQDDPLWRKGLEAFVSILGIGTAHAGAVSAESRKAPRQIDRQPDVIYITGRYIFGRGVNKLHSSVFYQIPSVAMPTWLSAFDTDTSLLGDGKLIGRTSDPRDNPLLMRFTLGTVQPPSGRPAFTHFFGDLVPAHAHYSSLPLSSLPDYDTIPELPPCGGCAGRNSNGYVHGLVLAAGGTPQPLPPLVFNDIVGWEYPVERSYFGQ